MPKLNQAIENQNDDIFVSLPNGEECINLSHMISDAPKNAVLRFETGTYRFNETITLNRSIKLVGNGMDKTILTSDELELLLNSVGNHQVELEAISFVTKSETPATGIKINGGTLKVNNCLFSGGIIDQEGKNGIGLLVNGATSIDIQSCRFESNENAGIWIDEQVQGKVRKNTFDNNEAGLVVVGKGIIESTDNSFTRNHVSLAYDESSTGKIENNSFIENRGGILIKGEANVEIFKNTFCKNDGAAGFFEKCEVLFEKNTIDDGFMTLVVRHTAKAIIRKNKIQDNDQGIICADQSNSEIIENIILGQDKFGILVQDDSTAHIVSNIIRENSAGIKFENRASFKAEKNQITLNKLYGILATDQSQGQVHRNIIEKNTQEPMGWNFEVRESADVDFDDYKEPQPEGIPVSFTLIDDQLVVLPQPSSERVSFTKFIAQCQPEQDVIIAEGEYQLSSPIIIDKPVNLIAKTPGEVLIKGEDLTQLMNFQGKGVLTLKGIGFSLVSSGQSNVVMVESGHLIMEKCLLEGARDHQGNKRDFGAGLLISGTASAAISNSVFKNNLLGIAVQDKVSIKLQTNEFSENLYGVVFRDQSTGSLSGNEYSLNNGYGLMAYDESEIVIANETNHHNQAGFGFMNHAKATIEESEAHNNEYHGFFIDGNASCEIKNSLSHSNEISGIAIYGDNITILEGNAIHTNDQAGIESAESAQSIIRANDLKSNNIGILLADNAKSEITNNTIHENEVGIKIQDEANGIINQNKIFSNAEGGIVNWSNSEPEIAENEVFDNGEPSDCDNEEQDEDNSGESYGDFLANLLGSENLSDDPNTAAIPITGDVLDLKGTQKKEEKDYQINLEKEGQISDGYYKFQILFYEDGELYANVYQIKVDPETTREWLEQEVLKIRAEFANEHPNAEIY